MIASAAWAQQSPMPAEIAAKLLEMGRVIDPPKTVALYAPLQQKEPYPGVKIERDVKYGAAERNLLDIFMPETAASPRPVLIFVHGGAFVGGNKRTTPTSPFYDNIMLWAAKNGFVGVNVTYRLAPQSPWPAGAQDLATAVRWIARQDRRTRRRSRAHLSDGTFRRRGSRLELCIASRISRGEGRRPRRRDHGLRHLRPDRDAACRDPARLFRHRSGALCRTLLAGGSGDDRHPADAGCRRTGPGGLRAAIRSDEASDLQAREPDARGRCCCRSTVTCRRCIRSTPRIRA